MDLATIVPFMLGPNIIGRFASKLNVGGESIVWSPTGAFYQDEPDGSTSTVASSNTGKWRFMNFNATGYNQVYTHNGKVYPLSLALNYIIKS